MVPDSPPSRAILKVEAEGLFPFSDATVAELAEALARPKFDAYLSRRLRDRFLASIFAISERVVVQKAVGICRDPRDDRLLEAAVNGAADVIVTGDRDLLVLGKFEAIPILSPAAFCRQT